MDKAQSELYGNVERLAEQETTNPKLLDINGEPIDPEWAALFAGFFWGEGTMIIDSIHNGKTYNPYCQVWLRADDGGILGEFASKLGGRLRDHPNPTGGGNPQRIWKISKIVDCHRIARLLETTAALPFRKRRELPIWREAIELKLANLYSKTDNDHYLQEMSRLKKQLSRQKVYEAL